MIRNIKYLLLASITLVACTKEEDEITEAAPSAGSANFSKFVALGDSFAAGFSDGALFVEGQKNSYPAIMAQQFKTVGGGDFKIPLMNDNVGGFTTAALGQGPRLVFNGQSPVSLGLPPYNKVPTTNLLPALTGGFNNFGVPGAKSFHLLLPNFGNPAGIGTTANPYFVHFASNTTNSVLQDALAQNPTFFSLWIGGNDVLGYATSGGNGTNPITPTTTFNTAYNDLVAQLVAGGKKGVVANLPYVSSLPYFTTVPHNPIPAFAAAQSGQLNQIFGGINQITTAMSLPSRFVTLTTDDGNPYTTEAANPVLIIDETLTDLSTQITAALTPSLGATTAAFVGSIYGRARHAKNNSSGRDFVLLPTRSVIGTAQAGVPAPFNVVGVTYPMQDSQVLTIDEASQIKAATDAYNITIKAAADTNNLAFFDAKALMNQLINGGIRFGNYSMTAAYVTGGAFSLDGIHPSARGSALIANKFVEAINMKYGSTIKPVDLEAYRIQYPASL